MAGVAFFYIDLLEQKSRAMTECYRIESRLREKQDRLHQLFHKYHEFMAIRNIHSHIEEKQLNVDLSLNHINLSDPDAVMMNVVYEY